MMQQKILALRELNKTQFDLAKEILLADKGNFYSVDFLTLAAINRSISNSEAFISLIEAENYLAAIPFIRMQLDSVLRLFALKLVDKPQEFAQKILDGHEVRKLKCRNGNKMFDSYLCDQLSKYDPWVKNVYESCSGFVHLSNKHMFTIFGDRQPDDTFEIRLGAKHSHVTEKLKVEALDAYSHCLKLLIDMCKDWLDKKKIGGD
jgi:hypothetical protein